METTMLLNRKKPTFDDLFSIEYGSLRDSRFYFDMDGVVADFEEGARLQGLDPKDFKHLPGAYKNLPWMPHAETRFLRWLDAGLNIWMATKIPTHNPLAATEKLEWLQHRRPELLRETIITPDKGTLGHARDVLIDDRYHKAHCDAFQGTFVHFGSESMPNWIMLDHWLEHVTGTRPA
jgi:hypothetical protein